MQNFYLTRRACALFLAVCLGLASRANAQSATQGAVGGTIFDINGAAIPNASVSIVNDGTGRTVPGDIRRQRLFQGAAARTWDLYGFHRRARVRRLS